MISHGARGSFFGEICRHMCCAKDNMAWSHLRLFFNMHSDEHSLKFVAAGIT